MKKLFMAAVLAVAVATSAFASDVTNVSKVVVSNFQSSFRDASDVKWTTVGNLAKASFVTNNERVEAYYNTDGDMIGIAKAISIESLPVNAKRTFAKKYDGYTVKEAIRFDGAEEVAYYISAENEKQSVILKVDSNELISTYKKTSK